jgi:hypothetical protein
LYITVLFLGVLANTATFIFLRVNLRIRKLTSAVIVQYLIGEDGLSSLTCLIQCCINFHTRRLLGEHAACVAEAWQVIFFITITSYTLCLISYILQRQVTGGFKTGSAGRFLLLGDCSFGAADLHHAGLGMDISEIRRFAFRAHIAFWTLGILLATGACVWPGRSRLTVSGTYCLPAFDEDWVLVFFFGAVVIPTALFLATQYLGIYLYLRDARLEVGHVVNFGEEKPRPPWYHSLKLARQLGSLVIAYYLFYTPFLSSACYEWVTGYFSPPWLDCLGGVMIHFSSAANPLLYVWTTKQARKAILAGFLEWTSPTASSSNEPTPKE